MDSGLAGATLVSEILRTFYLPSTLPALTSAPHRGKACIPACRSLFRSSAIIDRLGTGTAIAFTPESRSASARNRDRHHAGTLIGSVRNTHRITPHSCLPRAQNVSLRDCSLPSSCPSEHSSRFHSDLRFTVVSPKSLTGKGRLNLIRKKNL